MKRLIFGCLTVIVLCLAGPAWAVDFAGEKVTYEFGWRNISAATLDIRVKNTTVAGEPSYAVTLDIKGKPALDWIWRVRDRIDTLARAKDLRPFRYFFTQREGAFKLDTEITYDNAQNKLVSKRTRYKKSGTKQLRPKDAPGDHFDPVTSLMVVRRVEFKPGVVHTVKVFDGKRKHLAEYRCIGEKKLETKVGTFDTWIIKPKLIKSEGKDDDAKAEKVKDVTVWIQKDAPHHVLRVESEALWGYIYVELIAK
ncbi:MAG: DUF3108 domain-containing protein [Candidatus Lernaella stagnicola]|nr:DUF3108 domain-containing protein [Candidatus Lernaella stagnicola]